MKKLAVMVLLPAVVIFVAVAMASADKDGWGAIHGTYSMTASGGCLHSSLGFNANLTPITGSVVWGAIAMPQGIWTFDSHGTGTVSGTNYILDFPPGSPVFGGPIARQSPISFNFHYEVTDDGAITVFPPLPPNLVGMISKDHKTLTLSNANQVQAVGVLGYAICNFTRNLIRVEE
jgi:hypothetical protein